MNLKSGLRNILDQVLLSLLKSEVRKLFIINSFSDAKSQRKSITKKHQGSSQIRL